MIELALSEIIKPVFGVLGEVSKGFFKPVDKTLKHTYKMYENLKSIESEVGDLYHALLQFKRALPMLREQGQIQRSREARHLIDYAQDVARPLNKIVNYLEEFEGSLSKAETKIKIFQGIDEVKRIRKWIMIDFLITEETRNLLSLQQTLAKYASRGEEFDYDLQTLVQGCSELKEILARFTRENYKVTDREDGRSTGR